MQDKIDCNNINEIREERNANSIVCMFDDYCYALSEYIAC